MALALVLFLSLNIFLFFFRGPNPSYQQADSCMLCIAFSPAGYYPYYGPGEKILFHALLFDNHFNSPLLFCHSGIPQLYTFSDIAVVSLFFCFIPTDHLEFCTGFFF